MPSFLPDTNILIPVIQDWHENHHRATTEIRRRLGDGERMTLAAHSLVECYSVLTRLPRPHRMAPGPVLELIRASFVDRGTVVALSSERYLELLSTVGAAGLPGGRVYDAVIAACAREAKADVLLTFNVRDFTGLVPGLDVCEPAGR